MPRHGSKLWERHPHVRSGGQLSLGERAADALKHWFGTWTILGLVMGACIGYMLLAVDPGHLRLNLALSLMAAVQGIILQISANRGDRISAELAMHDHEMTQMLLSMVTCMHNGCSCGDHQHGGTVDGPSRGGA